MSSDATDLLLLPFFRAAHSSSPLSCIGAGIQVSPLAGLILHVRASVAAEQKKCENEAAGSPVKDWTDLVYKCWTSTFACEVKGDQWARWVIEANKDPVDVCHCRHRTIYRLQLGNRANVEPKEVLAHCSRIGLASLG